MFLFFQIGPFKSCFLVVERIGLIHVYTKEYLALGLDVCLKFDPNKYKRLLFKASIYFSLKENPLKLVKHFHLILMFTNGINRTISVLIKFYCAPFEFASPTHQVHFYLENFTVFLYKLDKEEEGQRAKFKMKMEIVKRNKIISKQTN